jgi:hypothetical protein
MQGMAHEVEGMATRFSVPPSKVQQILTEQLSDLERTARIKQFVEILAVKQVKEVLRKQADH